MTYLYTATVTSKIISTQFFTATATVLASNCPKTTTDNPNTIHSAASNGVHTSSTMETPTHSIPPANPSRYDTFSHSELPGSEAVSSQSSSLISATRSDKSIFSVPVSRLEASTFRSVIPSVSNKHPSGLSLMSQKYSFTTVRSTNPNRAPSMSYFDRGSLVIRGPGVASGETDYTVSTSGPLVDITQPAGMTLTEITSLVS